MCSTGHHADNTEPHSDRLTVQVGAIEHVRLRVRWGCLPTRTRSGDKCCGSLRRTQTRSATRAYHQVGQGEAGYMTCSRTATIHPSVLSNRPACLSDRPTRPSGHRIRPSIRPIRACVRPIRPAGRPIRPSDRHVMMPPPLSAGPTRVGDAEPNVVVPHHRGHHLAAAQGVQTRM